MRFIIYLEKEHCHTCKSKEQHDIRCSITWTIGGRKGEIRGQERAWRFSRREGPIEKWVEQRNRTRGEKAEMRIAPAEEGKPTCVVAGNREAELCKTWKVRQNWK